jgi:hypothetical protein
MKLEVVETNSKVVVGLKWANYWAVEGTVVDSKLLYLK